MPEKWADDPMSVPSQLETGIVIVRISRRSRGGSGKWPARQSATKPGKGHLPNADANARAVAWPSHLDPHRLLSCIVVAE